jgi:hypothetical protein
MREEKAASLRDIEDLVQSILGDKSAGFRGQSCASWDLVPSAYRRVIPLLHNPDFASRWANLVERDTYRDFEILARMVFSESLEPLEQLSVAASWRPNTPSGLDFQPGHCGTFFRFRKRPWRLCNLVPQLIRVSISQRVRSPASRRRFPARKHRSIWPWPFPVLCTARNGAVLGSARRRIHSVDT